MKKYIFSFLFFLVIYSCFSQENRNNNSYNIELDYLYGVIANHNSNILHLITDHPEGVLLSLSKKTFGENIWEQRYNYPDYGVSFLYQDFKNPFLGENYSLYGHYSFYFFKRNLNLKIGQGFAYVSNPYDKETNNRNIAFGSRVLSSTYLNIGYKKEQLFGTKFGLQSGVTLTHYSNGSFKSPNTSINTISLNIGLNYNLEDYSKKVYLKSSKDSLFVRDKIRYNIAFRSGVNQGDVLGIKQYPFYVGSFYVDKQIGNVSALQLGADAFFSMFLKEEIRYKSIAYPSSNTDPDADFKRVSLFVGHELFINKLSFVAQLGYYIYYPYKFQTRYYERIGFKRYFGDYVFGSITLKAHGAVAEALEFGVGVRL